jgi:predicted transcriptional regulator
MGIFDRWRRKEQPKTVIKLQEPKKPIAPELKTSGEPAATKPTDVNSLIAEYERLTLRREELQAERRELNERLDRGELSPDEFRTHLMDRIQEAAQVTENLRYTSAKLISLGYRGLHS